MSARIIDSEVILTSVQLPTGFTLGFGTLKDLPRAYLILTIEHDGTRFRSIGEASMDFPFSPYDMWDVYSALRELSLSGRFVDERIEILEEAWSLRERDGFLAAHAALNMALDDAYGRVTHQSIPDLYGKSRVTGTMLESIGILRSEQELEAKLRGALASGRTPKIKCTDDLEYNARTICLANQAARAAQGGFVADFNASLTLKEWQGLLARLPPEKRDRWIFAEQPTLANIHGITSLIEAFRISQIAKGPKIVADESFVTKEDAATLAKAGIWLNMKIQKVGGLQQALLLESVAQSANVQTHSLVGGTFPTAIGRAYDLCAAAVLKTATLASDGWMPSTDFLTGEQHMIEETFPRISGGTPTYFTAPGLGCTPAWDNLMKARIHDPAAEYRSIRTKGSGSRIRIELASSDVSYAELYTKVSGRDPLWNLS